MPARPADRRGRQGRRKERRRGEQVASKLLDNTGSPPGAGALFGLALTLNANGIYYVDDAANTLNLFH